MTGDVAVSTLALALGAVILLLGVITTLTARKAENGQYAWGVALVAIGAGVLAISAVVALVEYVA